MSSLGKAAKSGTRTPAKVAKVVRPQAQPPRSAQRSQGSEGSEHGASPATRAAAAKAGQAGSAPHLLNIGYGNLVVASRVVAVVSPQSSPMRRLREEASERGKLVDATHGRRTRSILVTDSDHVILSAINPETIASRITPDESPGGS